MSKKRFQECPYLWQISDKHQDVVIYAFANTPSEALKLVENELNKNELINIELVCFANDIVNFK